MPLPKLPVSLPTPRGVQYRYHISCACVLSKMVAAEEISFIRFPSVTRHVWRPWHVQHISPSDGKLFKWTAHTSSVQSRELDPRRTRKVKIYAVRSPRSNEMHLSFSSFTRRLAAEFLTLHVRGAALYSVNKFCAIMSCASGRTACLSTSPKVWNPTPTKKWKWKWAGLSGNLKGRALT